MPILEDKRNAYPAERRMETAVKTAVCKYTSFLESETRTHRRVGYKNSVAKFHMLVMSGCYALYIEFRDDLHRTGIGAEHEIFEPKYRIVTSTAYKDRIPQASFVTNYYYGAVVPNLIENNFACMKDRGVEIARNTFKEILKGAKDDDHCLVVDLKSYFDSIDHETLLKEQSRYITDEWAFWYYSDVINCNKKKIGIGLGSEMNQLSATALPDKLDHELDNGNYVRYMDDFRFVGTKEECEKALEIIEEETARLHLTISRNKTYIQPIKKPVKFLGFTFFRKPTGRVTMKKIKSKRNNERRKLRRMKAKGVPIERVYDHVQSVRATMKKGTRSGVVKYDKYVNQLFGKEIKDEYQKRQCRAGNADKKEQFHLTVSSRSKRGRRKNQPSDSGEILDVAGTGTAPQEA